MILLGSFLTLRTCVQGACGRKPSGRRRRQRQERRAPSPAPPPRNPPPSAAPAPGRRPTAIARARRARTQTRQIGSGAEKISLLDDISSQCPIVWGK